MIHRLAVSFLAFAVIGAATPASQAQFPKWLSAGEFQNWYSEMGSECDLCGLADTQQEGWRWPGYAPYTDAQVSKALWIGATDVTGPSGATYPFRVVHVGPRVSGEGEFFPVRFETVGKRPLTEVLVGGSPSLPPFTRRMTVDRVDPEQLADVMIETEVNTLLGITVERRVMQFSQDFHDDYHVLEYVFTNTGNTDGDAEIELPDQTLEGVQLFLPYRLAINANSRYAIDNSTGWGKNTMNDARGDGVLADPAGEDFRAQFAWHGNSPPFTAYDNLGAPLMPPAVGESTTNVAPGDTVGRFASHQFAGVVTLHADASAGDESDDAGQPSTTTWFHSDAPFTANNDPYNPIRMQEEYELMTTGHREPRHAYAVEPSGLPGFLEASNDPSLGTTGGFSFANGYGPYTLGPGESVRIVMAEGAGGLSREAATELGRQFKASGADAEAPLTYAVGGSEVTLTKNEWVFTSRDSLFQTFRRALASYDADYAIPRPPPPPERFTVFRGEDRVRLTWNLFEGASDPPGGWEIYRAEAMIDSTYHLIYTAAPDERLYDDFTTSFGVDHYYYIVAVGDGASNDGTGLTPAGVPLRSSRYYTQTYDPIFGVNPVANDDLATDLPTRFNVPSPYPNPFSDRTTLAFELPDAADVTAVVYDVRGREVARLADGMTYPAGRHALSWKASGLATGTYVVRLTAGDQTATSRLLLIR